MSTSLLYHAFGLKTYEYLRTEYFNGAVFFHVRKKGVIMSTFIYNTLNLIFLEVFTVEGNFLLSMDFLDFFKNSIAQSVLNIFLFGLVYVSLSKANKYFSFYDNRVRIKK